MPLALDRRPVDRVAAGLIGSPTVNVVEGEDGRGHRFDAEGLTIGA